MLASIILEISADGLLGAEQIEEAALTIRGAASVAFTVCVAGAARNPPALVRR